MSRKFVTLFAICVGFLANVLFFLDLGCATGFPIGTPFDPDRVREFGQIDGPCFSTDDCEAGECTTWGTGSARKCTAECQVDDDCERGVCSQGQCLMPCDVVEADCRYYNVISPGFLLECRVAHVSSPDELVENGGELAAFCGWEPYIPV